MNRSLVVGLQGLQLSSEERSWFSNHPPLGVILFSRNIRDTGQVKALLNEVQESTGEQTWAAIDEEGGRVNRIPWPPFCNRLPAANYGCRYEGDPEGAIRAVHTDAHAVGLALRELGFTHNCAPVLDIFHASANGIIGNRSYGSKFQVVAKLGAAAMRGLYEAGIEVIGKHFPGHGRADADSHLDVPHVDAELDEILREAEPYRVLFARGLNHIMTAHVIYSRVEERVATLSEFWLKDILRKRFGFQGRIWSDDLCMKGVGEDILMATNEAKAAGCDVLLVCEPEGVKQIYQNRCTIGISINHPEVIDD